MVSSMLRGAGYQRITFERFDCDICIGRDLAEAVEFAMALGPAGEIIRLAGPEGEKRRPEVEGGGRRSGGCWVQIHGDLTATGAASGDGAAELNRQWHVQIVSRRRGSSTPVEQRHRAGAAPPVDTTSYSRSQS
jgi:hypothetical protein